MGPSSEDLNLLRREIEAGDARTIAFFGLSTERRLADLSRNIALDDSITPTEHTNETLTRALDLFQDNSPRWLTALSKFLAILPFKSADQRFQDMAVEVQDCATMLRSRLLRIEDWDVKLQQLHREIELHVEAGVLQAASMSSSPEKVSLAERIASLKQSLEVSDLVAQGLQQSRIGYDLLLVQLSAVLGLGASAWHTSKLQKFDLASVEKAKDLTDACIEAEAKLHSALTRFD